LLSYSFYRNYYNSYKRNDSAAGIEYVLPFLRECELAYTYRSLSGPDEALNKCSVSYRNEFDFLKYMITFSRETDSLYNTINKSALFTGHYNISESVMLFADLSYDVVSMADDTNLFYGKIYTAYQF
ncbi:MAG: hypothetical protein KAS32_30895, partial [Candidatus Peribacteraceae bacterium]|nr:hypothetical protein [Candidatus Peribacteraceae bacterium]